MKLLGTGAVWLLVSALMACSANGSSETVGDPAQNKPVAEAAAVQQTLFPAFALPDLKGERVSLEELRGKVVLVVFWATWCPPCVAEVPVLNELWETYRDVGLEIVAIAVDPRESAEKIAKFADQRGVRYTVLLGTRETGRRYRIQGIPTSFLVGRDGEQLQRFVGYADPKLVEQAIVAALEN